MSKSVAERIVERLQEDTEKQEKQTMADITIKLPDGQELKAMIGDAVFIGPTTVSIQRKGAWAEMVSYRKRFDDLKVGQRFFYEGRPFVRVLDDEPNAICADNWKLWCFDGDECVTVEDTNAQTQPPKESPTHHP